MVTKYWINYLEILLIEYVLYLISNLMSQIKVKQQQPLHNTHIMTVCICFALHLQNRNRLWKIVSKLWRTRTSAILQRKCLHNTPLFTCMPLNRWPVAALFIATGCYMKHPESITFTMATRLLDLLHSEVVIDYIHHVKCISTTKVFLQIQYISYMRT